MWISFALHGLSLILCYKLAQAALDPVEVEDGMNQIRSVANPSSDHMTCLTWNTQFAATLDAATAGCTLLTGNDIAYDIRAIPDNYLEILSEWVTTGDPVNYDYTTNNCFASPTACDNFKLIMNEQANQFACSQSVCGTVTGCTDPVCGGTYTICKLDKPRTTGMPYTVSPNMAIFEYCTSTSCTAASDPAKTFCNTFICCSPSVTTTISTPTTTATTTTVPITDIVANINIVRAVVFPPADHITCLAWDTNLETAVNNLAATCAPVVGDNTVLTDVRDTPVNYIDLFIEWASENINYDFNSDTCAVGTSCLEFQTMMNDAAKTFACTQKSCSSFTGRPTPAVAYTYTVCKFDVGRKIPGPPYQTSGDALLGCSATSCNVVAPNTLCNDNFICCGSASTTSTTSTSTKSTATTTSTKNTGSTASTTSTKSTTSTSSTSSTTSTTPKTTATTTSSSTTSTSTASTVSTAAPSTNTLAICNSTSATTNWWCAKTQQQGQQAPSAIAADSCFCVLYKTQNPDEAAKSCADIGGYLTDIQNSNENTIINTVLQVASESGQNPAPNCPTNTYYYDGSCYAFQSSPTKNWKDAESACMTTYNGHLASIHSSAQQNFIFQTVTKSCSACTIYGFWVGGNNYGVPSNWRWSDGSSFDHSKVQVTGYRGAGWAVQPEDPDNQQCMTMVKPDGGWGDWFCSYAQPFVCQFPAPSSSAIVGLHKSVSGNYWTVGNNCPMTQTSYQPTAKTPDPATNTAFIINPDGTVTSISTTTTNGAAICRMDRNICGRSNCASCSTCSPTNGGTCYTCSTTTTPPVVAANPSAPATSIQTFSCGTSSSTAKWWCAKNFAEGQQASTALAADSCFCLVSQSQTQKQAASACSSVGGFLTDIQNANENTLVQKFLSISTNGASSNINCPAGSTTYNGLCYVYVSSPTKTWDAAEKYCQTTYGGHLASIHSSAQQQFIYSTLAKSCAACNIYGLWVGGNNGGNPTNWTWSDGTVFDVYPDVTTYAGWAKQPDAPTTQHKPDGGWGDWLCGQLQPFVCQFTPFSAWIGLQKSSSNHLWSYGSGCSPQSAAYQGWNAAADTMTEMGYTMSSSSAVWNSVPLNALASSAVCRLDKNVCGRSTCPSCTTCVSSSSGACYTCSDSTITTTSSTIVSNVLCNSAGTNWWCAKDNAAGQSVTTAVAADSCFCVMYQNQTQQQAFDSCSSMGGFLTDIQNANENSLVGTLLKTASSSSTSCPSNAVYYNGMCYSYQSNLLKTWQSAETYCQQTYSGHLASIQDTQQQDFLFYNLTKQGTGCTIFGYWVGGNNYGNPNNWKWSDGTALTFPRLTAYNKWPTQPDAPGSQQCMTIVKPDGGWGDWYCTDSQPFICAFTPASTSTAWIGLQRTLSGRTWNIGNNCPPRSSTYQNVNPSTEDPIKPSYTYTPANSMWTNVASSSIAPAAVCRLDRNICGRSPCPTCSTCTATNSGKCYSCSGVPTPTTSTPSSPAITASTLIACNTNGATTNWWCAKNQVAGQSVASAVAADSCFCVMQKNQTQQQAFTSCTTTGGFLTDIQNAAENSLIGTVIATYSATFGSSSSS